MFFDMDGRTLRERRQALGLSMEALAHMVGVSLQTIHRWETGKLKTGPLPIIHEAVLRVLEKLEAERRE